LPGKNSTGDCCNSLPIQGGLSENDVILAAKIDRLPVQLKV